MEPTQTPPVGLQTAENAIDLTADILQPHKPQEDEVDSLPVTRSSDDQDQVEDVSESDVVVSVDELKKKIIRQVEYYFSDENLPTDKFLLTAMKKTKKGFVPISTIATFHKMKKLTRDIALIVSALKESSFLVVSQDEKKVKRLSPLPEVRDPKIFTVLVENLPEDHSDKNIREIFGTAGSIKSISICDPNAVEDSEKGSKQDTFIRPRLHALVEFETVEAAEKAASTLNNDQDWRNGLRVKLLDQTGKFAQRRPARKEVDIEKDKTSQVHDQTGAEENRKANEHPHHRQHHSDSLADEPFQEGGHKNGNKGRGRGRGRQQNHQGHGTAPSASSSSHHNHYHHAVAEVSKRPPGPKMPDGTRGFTTGRGKPLPPPLMSAQSSHEV